MWPPTVLVLLLIFREGSARQINGADGSTLDELQPLISQPLGRRDTGVEKRQTSLIRGLLGTRQNTCPEGNGYCTNSGRCCKTGGQCCEAGRCLVCRSSWRTMKYDCHLFLFVTSAFDDIGQVVVMLDITATQRVRPQLAAAQRYSQCQPLSGCCATNEMGCGENSCCPRGANCCGGMYLKLLLKYPIFLRSSSDGGCCRSE